MKRPRRNPTPGYGDGREFYVCPHDTASDHAHTWRPGMKPWQKMQHFCDVHNWIHTRNQDVAFRAYWHAVPTQFYHEGDHKVSRRHA